METVTRKKKFTLISGRNNITIFYAIAGIDTTLALNSNGLKNVYLNEYDNLTSYYRGVLKHFKEHYGLKDYQAADNKKNKEKFVLIIDEINRGNISKIFGESLIEGDKRIGESEALSVQLPYSGKNFSVPSNLSIISTMNTADRSCLLDTALRRRFRFRELMPNYGLLKNFNIEDIDIEAMLKAINEKIIKEENGRELQIGHSFFLKLKDTPTINSLAEVFQYEVLPLLEEYFFENRKKVNEGLNKNGFYKKETGSWELNQDALKQETAYIKIYS